MYIFWVVALAVLAYAPLSSGIAIPDDVSCSTLSGTKTGPSSVPTTIVTTIVHSTSTITPSTTKTVTVTQKQISTIINTIIETSTIALTTITHILDVEPYVITWISTTGVSVVSTYTYIYPDFYDQPETTTTTVSKASGFTPIRLDPSLTGPVYTKWPQPKTYSDPPSGQERRNIIHSAAATGTLHPTKVVCTTTVTKVTSVGSKSATTSVTSTASVVSKTIKTTVTSLTTIPVSFLTIYSYGTSLKSATYTTTDFIYTTEVSLTTTANLAGPTYYEVCEDPNNYVWEYKGFPAATYLQLNNKGSIFELDVDSAHDCCVLCQQTPNCGISMFDATTVHYGYEGFCYLLYNNGTCDAGQEVAVWDIVDYEYPSVSGCQNCFINISNSNCGQAHYWGEEFDNTHS